VSDHWLFIDVNPEPWAVGPLALGRRNGKMYPRMERNAGLHAFKEAVKGDLEDQQLMLPEGEYDLEFYFYRRLDSHIAESGRKVNAHVADATNMQKATEDALQGVLFGNDRDVRQVRSTVVEQGPDIKGCIIVHAQMYVPLNLLDWYPHDIREKLMASPQSLVSDNTWPPA